MLPNPQSYKARWIFPVDGEPLENATIEIQDGIITALHTSDDPHATDLENTAIIPGLINTHTHLEFSDLEKPFPATEPFTNWIRQLVAYRNNRPESTAIESGLRESLNTGTTTLGEIATRDWPTGSFPSNNSHTVLFREILGRLPEQIDELTQTARTHLEAADSQTEPNIIRGLSPHAPYSVHPDLYQNLINLAAQHHAPLAIHLAETQDELQLLNDGTGDLVEMLKDFNVWRNDVIPKNSKPLDYLTPLEKLDHALIIHGNYLAEEELNFLANHANLTLVYCPRTHAFFNHAPHPWRELLQRNGHVALGTDGKGSNPDLNLFNELRFLHNQFPDAPPQTLLQLGTINGAHAFGLDSETGTLTVGKRADMACVSLDDSYAPRNPYNLLFAPRSRITPNPLAEISPN